MRPFDPLVYALIAFGIATLVGHLAFVWRYPRPATFWRVADYAAIALAGLGVISVSAEVRQHSADDLVRAAQEKASRNLDDLARIVDLSAGLVGCAEPEAQTMTPALCDWQWEAGAALLALEQEMSPAEGKFDKIEHDAIPDGEHLFSEIPNPARVLKARILDYNDVLEDIKILRATAADRAYERAFSASAPFLIALGAAIKITKVSADARRDSVSANPSP